jgi:hypothetical protein
MGSARQQFEEALKAEIWRAVQVESHNLTKDQIEGIGENAGVPRERVERQFLRLAGRVWAGYIYPNDAPPESIWVDSPPRKPLPEWSTVSFPREWFQRQGIVPTPPLN